MERPLQKLSASSDPLFNQPLQHHRYSIGNPPVYPGNHSLSDSRQHHHDLPDIPPYGTIPQSSDWLEHQYYIIHQLHTGVAFSTQTGCRNRTGRQLCKRRTCQPGTLRKYGCRRNLHNTGRQNHTSAQLFLRHQPGFKNLLQIINAEIIPAISANNDAIKI